MMHITAVHHPGAAQGTHHLHHAGHHETQHHHHGRPTKVDKATQVDVDLENMSKILSGVRTSETIEIIPFIDQLGGTVATVPGATAIVTSNGTLRLLQQNGATIVGPNSGYVTLAAPGALNATHFVTTPVASSAAPESPPPPEELEDVQDSQPQQTLVIPVQAKKNNANQSRPYSCEECNRSFRFVENLQKHIQQGHSEETKPHKCETCGKRFPHQWNLNRHIQSHTGERPHMCEICNKRFMRAQHLDQHRKVHEGQRYPCDICGKQFTHLRNLQRHKRTHGQRMYACDQCEECFMQPEYLAEHKKIHGSNDYKPDLYTLEAAPGSIGEESLQYEQLQAAEPQVHVAPTATVVATVPGGATVVQTPVVVNNAGHATVVHAAPQHHHQQQSPQFQVSQQPQIVTHHPTTVTVVQQAASVSPNANVNVNAASAAGTTVTITSSPAASAQPGSHVCNECGKCFSNPNNLSRHKKNHNAFRPYACPICEKRFFQVQHLQQHKKCHEGQRYGCEHCGKQFTHPRNLQRHRLIHTGARPYVCPQCNKAFNQSTHLYKHINIHQKLPHACRRCGERFRYKTERERHKKAVHSNRDSDGGEDKMMGMGDDGGDSHLHSMSAPLDGEIDDDSSESGKLDGIVKLEPGNSSQYGGPMSVGSVKLEGSHNHGRPDSVDSYSNQFEGSDSGSGSGREQPVIAMKYDSKGAITSATIDAGALRSVTTSSSVMHVDGESNGSDPSGSETEIQFQQRYITHEFIAS